MEVTHFTTRLQENERILIYTVQLLPRQFADHNPMYWLGFAASGLKTIIKRIRGWYYTRICESQILTCSM